MEATLFLLFNMKKHKITKQLIKKAGEEKNKKKIKLPQTINDDKISCSEITQRRHFLAKKRKEKKRKEEAGGQIPNC